MTDRTIALRTTETAGSALKKAAEFLMKPDNANDKSSVFQDARLLLCEATGLSLGQTLAHPDALLTEEAIAKFTAMLEKRAEGVSVAAITGHREFCGIDFAVCESTLIPRPETELLAETAIDETTKRHKSGDKLKILDLCTGSGCIGLSIAKTLQEAGMQPALTLSDISADALKVAAENARRLHADAELLQGDLFAPMPGRRFDLMTANPPYVSEEEYRTLSAEVLAEPKIALVSQEDGLRHIRRILENAPNHMEDGGVLLMEIGDTQGEAAKAIAKGHGFGDVAVLKDLGGFDRMLKATFRTPSG